MRRQMRKLLVNMLVRSSLQSSIVNGNLQKCCNAQCLVWTTAAIFNGNSAISAILPTLGGDSADEPAIDCCSDFLFTPIALAQGTLACPLKMRCSGH